MIDPREPVEGWTEYSGHWACRIRKTGETAIASPMDDGLCFNLCHGRGFNTEAVPFSVPQAVLRALLAQQGLHIVTSDERAVLERWKKVTGYETPEEYEASDEVQQHLDAELARCAAKAGT